MWMISRVRVTSNGFVAACADDGQLDRWCPAAPRILSTASSQRAAIDQLAVDVGDIVARLDAGRAAGVSSVGAMTLTAPSSMRDGEAEAAIFAFGLCPQIQEIARVEIGAVRIEAGQHPVDRALDQRLVINLST